jgi:LPPG:FO 2-phospho-L-lactate transferase
MTDEAVETHVLVGDGSLHPLHFQQYLVQRGAVDEIRGIEYRGSARAHPTPEVRAALGNAEAIFIAPSNPVASIGPILAIPGIREILRGSRAPIVAVSPVIGGESLKGPTDKFLRWAEVEVSPLGVARLYHPALAGLDGMLIDSVDAGEKPRIEEVGIRVSVGGILMRTAEQKRLVARAALKFLEEL